MQIGSEFNWELLNGKTAEVRLGIYKQLTDSAGFKHSL